MRRFLVSLTVAGAVLAAPAEGVAGDPGAGKRKATACAVCHGKDGISKRADAPSIAGQSEVYLVSALKAYRDGERRNEMMSVMARTLSDEDIADLAAWFASFEIEVKARP
jgi:cytochrome c553